MITLRKAEDRGQANHGWLNSHHTFSFADYRDPRHMGFRSLRVINDDTVQPGKGFSTHGHENMEIISYVLDGALEHKDSMGTGSIIRPGDVQRMSAGRGVLHSELNHSKTEGVHFLQIWILPAEEGGDPGYEQKNFSDADKTNRLRLVASPDGASGSVTVRQDARIYATRLEAGQELRHALPAGRHAWLQVARGELLLNGQKMRAGDGAAISDESTLTLKAEATAEALLFDLA